GESDVTRKSPAQAGLFLCAPPAEAFGENNPHARNPLATPRIFELRAPGTAAAAWPCARPLASGCVFAQRSHASNRVGTRAREWQAGAGPRNAGRPCDGPDRDGRPAVVDAGTA